MYVVMAVSRGKPLLADSWRTPMQLLGKTKRGDGLIFHGRACLFWSIPFLALNRIIRRNRVGYQPHTRLRPILLNRLFLNTFFDKVFCLTAHNRRELDAYGVRNCIVVPNPIPVERLAGAKEGNPKKEYDVVWAGRDAPCKRLGMFISAMKANPKIRVLILAPRLMDENRPLLSGARNITCIEGLDGKAFFHELQKGKAFAFTSDENEGFPVSILEAAYLGMPIACSDFPKYREMLGGGASYFSDWEGLVRIIRTAAEGNGAKPPGKALISRYMPETISKLYESW
ncbi:Glycosyl transferases group 1 [uncultured archaeon]|nr:Glycosyl transferases group 1 [uncultured archaeon]